MTGSTISGRRYAMAQEARWFPRMLPALPPPRLTADISEPPGGEAYVVEIPVPGLKPDEIVIEVASDSVKVSTEPRQSEADSGQRYLQREQTPRPMSRIFEFPMDIDTDNVRVTLENGMLKLYLPKAAVGRRWVIRVAGSA
jgi:HSP20 family protein